MTSATNSNSDKSVMTFNVSSGAMYVVDPEYGWCRNKIEAVKDGTWQADVDVFRLDDEENPRISYLHVIHTDELADGRRLPFDMTTSFPRDGWEKASFAVHTSSATIGFFDCSSYTETFGPYDELLNEVLELLFEKKAGIHNPKFEEVTQRFESIMEMIRHLIHSSGLGAVEFGAASKTAWNIDNSDHHEYPCFYRRNNVGQIVEAVVLYKIDMPVLRFVVSSGVMCVTDPDNSSCQEESIENDLEDRIEPVKNGTWLADIGQFRYKDENFLRVSHLHVIHADEQVPNNRPPFGKQDAFPRPGWEMTDFKAYACNGQVGFLDCKSYENAIRSASQRDETCLFFESLVGEIYFSEFVFGVIEYGVASTTAWGNGGYPCFFRRNAEGLIVEAVIDFITKCGCGDEDYQEEDA